MLDCIIVGSGTAGVSAALTLKANAKEFMLIGPSELSEKIEKAELIRNYPGLSKISGKDFCAALKTQLAEMEIPVTNEKVTGVYALNEKFGVATSQGGYYEARTVILACGVESIKTIAGETELVGKGVSYCATCDGFLYKGKTIGVLCTAKRLEHEIEYLANLAQKVYAVPMYKSVEIKAENVEIIRKMPLEIQGDTRVTGMRFADKEVALDGFFALRESVPPTILTQGIETENGHIKVDREMATNLVGCYAAGDCTGRPYQYAKAVGEGNIAAHSVTAFLAKV